MRSTAPTDATVVDAPFTWNPTVPLSRLRIGSIPAEFEPAQPGRGRGGDTGRAGGEGRGSGEGRGRGGATSEEERRQAEERLQLLNAALEVNRNAGARLEPIQLPGLQIASMIGFILSTEGAAAFDDLTRSPDILDPTLNTWPNTFRTHRFVPAVESIRAQRARTLLMREMDGLMSKYDAFISSTSSGSLGLTNLTGHPAVAVRAGFVDNA